MWGVKPNPGKARKKPKNVSSGENRPASSLSHKRFTLGGLAASKPAASGSFLRPWFGAEKASGPSVFSSRKRPVGAPDTFSQDRNTGFGVVATPSARRDGRDARRGRLI
jgi:hypothetical protein